MGVKGLLGYMSESGSQPAIREKIIFFEEIELWQLEKGGRPRIIIDLKEFIHVAVQNDPLGLLCGGRYGTHLHHYRTFFRALKDAKAELIFFAMGNKLNYDLSIFIPNQDEEYRLHLNKLDRIDGDGGKINFKNANPRAPLAMHYNMHKLAREFGEMRINYVRHNQEIAKYIKEHDGTVLAVITNDNDFMVFDGDFQFWQANDVDMRNLTGVRMCRQKLRSRLDLTSQQLQVLSALSGSMFLEKNKLKSFHKRIRDEAVGNHYIGHLAKYIRDNVRFVLEDDGETHFDVDAIAHDVFGENCTEENLDAIKKGIAQYDLSFSTIDTSKHMTKAMEFAKTHDMFIYKLLTDDVHLITDIAFIDFRNYRSKNYAELIVPLLQKLYGILLENDLRRPRERTICMKYLHDEPYKVQNEPIVYPPMKLPDLFDLVFQPKNRQHDDIRWKLLQWLFDLDSRFVRSLERMSKEYFAVLVTIKYLLQQEEISIDEADAILTTENFTIDLKWPKKTTVLPRKLNTASIRIAHLYAKMNCFVCRCIGVCGLSELTGYLMFDGQFFQKTMEDFVLHPEKKTKAVESIRPYRIYS